MKTFTAHTLENVFDLRTLSLSEKAIDAIELTDEELGRATGSCFGDFGGWGCGCFIPVIPICCDFCGFGGWGGGFGGGFGGFGGGWGW
jgi:hypothetical protein